MKLSIPKPIKEMLPAKVPATTATNPSILFHAMVKYSSRFPRWAASSRLTTDSIAKAYTSKRGLESLAGVAAWM
jgi:hypothetical protein